MLGIPPLLTRVAFTQATNNEPWQEAGAGSAGI